MRAGIIIPTSPATLCSTSGGANQRRCLWRLSIFRTKGLSVSTQLQQQRQAQHRTASHACALRDCAAQ